MKIQDILFIVVIFAMLGTKRNYRLFLILGLSFILLAISLFANWIFFTAERFTWYAAACFLLAIFLQLLHNNDK